MQKEQIIKDAVTCVRSLYEGNSDGHDLDHTLRVYHLAMEIADSEPDCDRWIVAIAAILHDADDPKLFSTEDNRNARSFLMSRDVDQEEIERICAVINSVSFSKNRGKHPEDIESMIVQDADRLDAMGAVGIARTFAYGGKHGRSLDSSVQHFYDKLLLLKDLMNTSRAKEMAEKRHRIMVDFLNEWDAEMRSDK